jgi:hypothetical protein
LTDQLHRSTAPRLQKSHTAVELSAQQYAFAAQSQRIRGTIRCTIATHLLHNRYAFAAQATHSLHNRFVICSASAPNCLVFVLVLERSAFALQSLFNRIAIDLQSHCNRSSIGLQSLFNRIAIALQSHCNRSSITLQLLCFNSTIPSRSLCDHFASTFAIA